MRLPQEQRATARREVREIGSGGGQRTYAVTGVLGSLGQMAWRTIAVLDVLALGMLILMRPASVVVKVAIVAGVLVVWFGLRLGWRRLSAAAGLNRCRLNPEGLVLTNQFGRPRASVAWADVTSMKCTYGAWLFTMSHRFELTLRGAPPVVFNVLGSKADLVKELQTQAARNKIPQKNVQIRVHQV